MITLCRIIPGAVHEMQFNRDGSLSLYSEDVTDRLFFLAWRNDTNAIVMNDCMNGVWGEEVSINSARSGDGNQTVYFKFNGTLIEIWTSEFATAFERFDRFRAERVGLAYYWQAKNPGNSLSYAPEPLSRTLMEIDARLLHKRLDAIGSLELIEENKNER